MSGDIFTVTARGKGYYWHLGGREAKSSAKHPEMPRAGPQSKAYPQHASSATVEDTGTLLEGQIPAAGVPQEEQGERAGEGVRGRVPAC